MDPLSIATSVAGLIAAGGKLAAILTQISRLSDAPPLCKAALTEVCDTAVALRQVQNFLNGQLHIPSERREHVLLEHVAAALTGCVMTKDELETLLDGMGLVYAGSGITGVFNRVKWIRKEQDIQRLVQRLQNHKASLNLILTIFQCSSFMQIQDSVIRLSSLVEEAVSSHSALSIRLGRLEGGSTLRSPTIQTSRANDAESINSPEQEELGSDDASVVIVTRVPEDQSQSEDQFVLAPLAFDSELQASRVYRRLQLLDSDGHSETSITTSTRQRAAASIFSALSLAEISNLSQYSLPIFIQEIGNSQWYIQVGRISMTPNGIGGTTSGISFDVTCLSEKRKTYTMQPSNTGYDLKELASYLPPNEVALIYTYSFRLFKIQDHKTFEEQGITADQVGARVYILLRYRAGGGKWRPRSGRRLRGEDEYKRFDGG
jgi:hypothetical protein